MADDRESLVSLYFNMGLVYRDITYALATQHGLVISVRHVKRILQGIGLSRRKNYSSIVDVVDFIQGQLHTSGQLHGYRWMYNKITLHGFKCKKEDVRAILRILDAEGTERRRKRRLIRRKYVSKGPNYIWHFDSYDKLKPYGICINGCVDGYSRKVVWMNAYYTNSDPQFIGGYFMETVESLGGCPRVVRADMGTENGTVRDMQRFLRRNHNDVMSGELSYREGPSTGNQRVEYWWSFLRRECTDFWISLFRGMLDDGTFDTSFLDINLVRFCFLHLIQNDLDDMVNTWNHHLIRPSRNAFSPSGRPNVMYRLPVLHGTIDYLCPVPPGDVAVCKEECMFRELVPCDKDVYDMCMLSMRQNDLDFPGDTDSALTLYRELRQQINTLIY